MGATFRTEVRENVRLAAPIVATQIGMMLMGMVDTAIVGRVGENALASVSIGNTLTFAAMVPAWGIFMAIEPLASQAFGAGDAARVKKIRREGMRIALLLTIPFALLTLATLPLLELLHVDPVVIPGARSYLFTRLPSLLPIFVFTVARTYQQAVGRTRAAFEAVVFANVVHAIAAYVTCFGDAGLTRVGLPALGIPAYGGVGAGLATSASSTLMAVWITWFRGRPPKGALDAPSPGVPEPSGLDRELIAKIFRVGVPIGLQVSAEVGIFSLVTVLMGRLGGRATAAHQIALGLTSFSFMGALGIAQATSVRVGLSIGESRSNESRRAGLIGIGLGVATMAVWALVFALAPRLLARLFTPESAVIEAAVPLIRVGALFQLADGAQVVAAGALRGTGDTRWPLVINVVTHWFVGLPLGILLAFVWHRGAIGLWFGLTAGLTAVAAALVARFFWKTAREIAPI